jgi:hypothetical protein
MSAHQYRFSRLGVHQYITFIKCQQDGGKNIRDPEQFAKVKQQQSSPCAPTTRYATRTTPCHGNSHTCAQSLGSHRLAFESLAQTRQEKVHQSQLAVHRLIAKFRKTPRHAAEVKF